MTEGQKRKDAAQTRALREYGLACLADAREALKHFTSDEAAECKSVYGIRFVRGNGDV